MSEIRRVAIIGIGLIGGSLGLALRARRPDLEIHGITKDEGRADAARRRGAVTSASTHLDDTVGADVVVIATPLRAVRGVLESLTGIRASTLLTDVASVKAQILDWAAESNIPPDGFLGTHPMAGRSDSGLEAAQATLFEGAPWIITPRRGQRLEPYAPWLDCLRTIGAHVREMDADEHDRRIALVSHLAFVLSSAFVDAVAHTDDAEATAALAGPGFKDMIRLATGDPRMHSAIAEFNRAPLVSALGRFESSLRAYRRLIQDGDPGIERLLAEGQASARRWLPS